MRNLYYVLLLDGALGYVVKGCTTLMFKISFRDQSSNTSLRTVHLKRYYSALLICHGIQLWYVLSAGDGSGIHDNSEHAMALSAGKRDK